MSKSEADQISLGDLLSQAVYKIPRHQRGYAWSKSEVNDFLSDIQYLVDSKDSSMEHYFGTIIVFDEPKGGSRRIKKVIDGQQRLTTVSLFIRKLCSEKDWALEKLREFAQNDIIEKSEEDIDIEKEKFHDNRTNRLLFDYMPESGSRTLHFKPPENTEHFTIYKNIMKNNSEKNKELEFESAYSHRIQDAFLEIESWFYNLRENYNLSSVSGIQEYGKELDSIIEVIADRFIVTKFSVEDHAQAGRMFNVINNRGKDLNAMDRIKSHLIYQQSSEGRRGKKEQLDRIQTAFSDIQQTVTSKKREFTKDMNRLVRLHWPIFYDGISTTSNKVPVEIQKEPHLPEKPKIDVEDQEKWIKQYVDSLEELSKQYQLIYSPFDIQVQNEILTNETKRKLYTIISFSGNKGIIALILSAFRNLQWREQKKDKETLKRLISGLESVVMRSHRITKNGTNTMKKDGYKYANQLEWWDKSQEYEEIFGEEPPAKDKDRLTVLENIEDSINDKLEETDLSCMKTEDVRDGHYEDGWSGLEDSTIQRILSEFEVVEYSTPSERVTEVNHNSIEHIIPQNEDKSPLEDHSEYINNFGNLILISLTKNKNASDKKFRNKKEIYKEPSSTKMAKEIAEKNNTFTKQEIEDRQERIEEFVEERWPKKVETLVIK